MPVFYRLPSSGEGGGYAAGMLKRFSRIDKEGVTMIEHTSTFENRMKEFAGQSIEDAGVRHIVNDERVALHRRAVDAFWALLKTKVSADDYKALRKAWLAVDDIEGLRVLLETQAYYWAGFEDGRKLATMPVDKFATATPPRYSEAETIAEIERLERAAMNGAAEKVGI